MGDAQSVSESRARGPRNRTFTIPLVPLMIGLSEFPNITMVSPAAVHLAVVAAAVVAAAAVR